MNTTKENRKLLTIIFQILHFTPYELERIISMVIPVEIKEGSKPKTFYVEVVDSNNFTASTDGAETRKEAINFLVNLICRHPHPLEELHRNYSTDANQKFLAEMQPDKAENDQLATQLKNLISAKIPNSEKAEALELPWIHVGDSKTYSTEHFLTKRLGKLSSVARVVTKQFGFGFAIETKFGFKVVLNGGNKLAIEYIMALPRDNLAAALFKLLADSKDITPSQQNHLVNFWGVSPRSYPNQVGTV